MIVKDFIKKLKNRLGGILCISLVCGIFLPGFSCSKSSGVPGASQTSPPSAVSPPLADIEDFPGDREVFIDDYWSWTFGDAGLPDELARKTVNSLMREPAFVMELLQILEEDPRLYVLVDKQHALPQDYVPVDLVNLTDGAYRVTNSNFMLCSAAAASLEKMAAAARAEGIVLTAASTYRSYDYQIEVYNRYVREMGREAADRISARPGHSQHQLGLVVDFYPIDDAFADTPAGVWMLNNAGRFGWSLSFPRDHEEITGYSWESWHYRYTGVELAAFIDKYFDGIQQYALQFIRAWIESS